jgi:DNA-directed RNA polymerase subunit RPC12/RpoP
MEFVKTELGNQYYTCKKCVHKVLVNPKRSASRKWKGDPDAK